MDADAAEVVKRIFRLFLEGNGYGRIAGILNGEGIPCPEVYRKSKGLPVTGHKGCVEWTGIVVKRLLSNEYYTGDSVHGKTGGNCLWMVPSGRMILAGMWSGIPMRR